MDRKGKKRKEREKKVRAKKLRVRQKMLEEDRQQKRYDKLFAPSDEFREQLECEVLLATIGLEVSPQQRREAGSFLKRLTALGESAEDLGRYLDDLFALAHGKIPRRYAARLGLEHIARLVFRSMRGIVEILEREVTPLISSPIGERVCNTDDLDAKLGAACDAKRAAILAWDQQWETVHRKLAEAEGDGNDDGGPEVDDDFRYQFARGTFVETVTRPMESIQRWQLGVPTDFYRDVAQLADELTVSSALFFLSQLYAAMIAHPRHPVLQEENSLGMIPFRFVLKWQPEQYLPDPACLEALQALARRLDQLGGSPALPALERLHAMGEGYAEALAKLERLGRGQQTFSLAGELLTCGAGGTFLLERCGEYPSFIGAYEVLRATGHPPEESAAFLRDYGDYAIGATTLADVVRGLERRPEAVKLLVKNALYFCCGEGAPEMVALLDDVPKATKALRYYLRFAQAEEPYKQLAVLRYLKHHGVEGLETFAEHLERHRDDWVGDVLREADQEAFISRIAALAEPEPTPTVHPLRGLRSFDLIRQYNLTPELAELSAAALGGLDTVLQSLRRSRYVPVLLGQGHLRQRLVACLGQDANQTAVQLSHLPPDGNPYLVLKKILEPPPAEPPPAAREERPPEYERIVLIASSVDPETVAHLTAALGIPVHVISVAAASNRFNAIRQGDVVVYETTKTSHPAYYRAKNLTARRGATFRHAARTHRDALVAVVRS